MEKNNYGICTTGYRSIKPFKVSVSDELLKGMKQLLRLSRVPGDTYENTQSDRRYGVPLSWIRNAKDEWETNFDW
jgi:microsomal epoxide hydrolase